MRADQQPSSMMVIGNEYCLSSNWFGGNWRRGNEKIKESNIVVVVVLTVREKRQKRVLEGCKRAPSKQNSAFAMLCCPKYLAASNEMGGAA